MPHSNQSPLWLRRSAFTLFELVLVLTIIGIVASMAMPRYAKSIARFRVTMAADRIVADFRLAGQRAMNTGEMQMVKFTPASNKYSIPDFAHLDNPSKEYEVFLADDPYGADLVSADFGGSPNVKFDIYGAADNAGQVVVAVGEWQKTVSLDAESGRATVE